MVAHKIKLSPFFIMFCFIWVVILSLWHTVANAGEYFLIERESYQLCHDLVKNFNRFKDEEPMVCERKFHLDYKNFRLPKWEELKPEEFADTLDRLLVKETRRSWPIGISDLRNRISEGKVKLWRSQIDINFDGRANTIYMMQEYVCETKRDYTRDNMPRYRFMAEQNDPDPKNPRFEFLNGSVFGGIFHYKGRPYFHSWIQYPLFTTDKSRSIEGPSQRIAVYETHSPYLGLFESFGHKPVCEIGYRN